MLRSEDISEAVEAQIITAEQARGLEQIAAARQRARARGLGRDEHFRLLGGFNDFFIALGVFFLGVAFLAYPVTLMRGGGVAATVLKEPQHNAVAIYGMGILVFWGLAEYLTGRLKLVAPSIVIVVFLAFFAGVGADLAMGGIGKTGLFASILPVAIVGLHYARFRLPFSLFLLALTAVWLVVALFVVGASRIGLTQSEVMAAVKWVVLGCGVGVFCWAMAFDVSDTDRLSRRAACGFWLHLLAAPLIVHPLAGPLMNFQLVQTSIAQGPVVSASTVPLVLALVALLSAVALIVDRRALLVAGLGYLVSAMVYAISKWSGVSGGSALLPTLMFVGVLMITLGVGWRPIRAALMAALPGRDWKTYLPPYGKRP